MRRSILIAIGTLSFASVALAAKDAPKAPPASTAPDKQQQGAATPAPGQPAQPSPEEIAAREKALMDAFSGKENFTLSGKVLFAQEGQLVLQREDMPPAFLIVPGTAKVSLDGKTAKLDQITPGAEVRATFNLAQQYPIALSVDAKAAPASKTAPGATKPKTTAPAPGPTPSP